MKKEIDRKLLAALRAREPQGLEEAIGRYSPYVAGVLRKVLGQLGTQEDLEELSSDVFVALWQSAEGLREDSDLKLWLGVVARNRALKHLRALRLEDERLPLSEIGVAYLPEQGGTGSAALFLDYLRAWARQESEEMDRFSGG